MRVALTILLACIFTGRSYCQSDSILTDRLYDTFLEESADEEDEPDLYNVIEYYKNNPLDLNKTNSEGLMKLPFIDYRTAQEIIKYKIKYGRFFSLAELNSLDTEDKNIVKRIMPFLRVDMPSVGNGTSKTKEKIKGNPGSLNLSLRSRMISSYGNTSNKDFSGTLLKQYNRLIISSGDYQFGIITEKDAGENNLFDFSSMHFAIRNKESKNLFVLGDYSVEFGQGLVMWGSYGSKKSSDVHSIIRNDRNIIPYLSVNENKYLRGIAFSTSLDNYSISSFISYNKFDAKINDTSGAISSIVEDGNHRTQTELNHKDMGKEILFGARADYFIDSLLSAGFLYCHSNLTPALMLNPMSEELNKTDIYSLACKLFIKDIFISTETAASNNKLSVMSALNLSVNSKLQFVISYRNYDCSFMSMHSSSGSEYINKGGKETGIYSGLKLYSTFGGINIYYDQFKFSANPNSEILPVKGSELMFFYHKELNKDLELSLKYRLRKKDKTVSDKLTSTGIATLNNSRVEIVYNLNKNIRMKSRIDYCLSVSEGSEEKDKGFSFYQDLMIKISKILQLSGRITYYNTGSYNSRLYEYENDLPGVTSSTVLSGRGIKVYFLLGYMPNEKINISLKYHQDDKYSNNTKASLTNDAFDQILKENNKLSLQVDIKI